jgi:hypothetical protein
MFVVVLVPWHDEDRRCANRARSVFVAASRVWTVLVWQFPFEKMFLVELVFRPDSGQPTDDTRQQKGDTRHASSRVSTVEGQTASSEHPRNGKSL